MEQRVQLRVGTMETISNEGDVDREQVLETFGIENETGKETNGSRSFDVGYSSGDTLETLPKASKVDISPADVLKTLFFILVWYNKTLLGDDLGKFPAPLLMNTIHFSIQAVLSKMITWYWSGRFQPDVTISWRDYFVRVFRKLNILYFHKLITHMACPFAVVPTALGTAMDINLSNESLVFISVTFATMVSYFIYYGRSMQLLWNLRVKQGETCLMICMLESPSLKLFGIISVISAGVLLTAIKLVIFSPSVAKETEFEFWGFVFVMLAAVMSGFRWCMTQVLLQVYSLTQFLISVKPYIGSLYINSLPLLFVKETFGLKNPFIFMSCVAPVMAIATGLLSLLLDPWSEFRDNKYFDSGAHFARTCFLMLFGGALAFCMVEVEASYETLVSYVISLPCSLFNIFFQVLTEYVLVSVTSAVTVTIAGVVKEAVTIVVCPIFINFLEYLTDEVAVFYFHDEFTWLKGVGLMIIMVGVSLFNWYKYDKLQKGHKTEEEKQLQAPSQTGKYVILDEMDDQENSP
ncbi:F12K11.18 [Arabidopsis thaliana]|nr:F12K11.18 [Arabidopsis thaliana]